MMDLHTLVPEKRQLTHLMNVSGTAGTLDCRWE